jgi:hypothetical protein
MSEESLIPLNNIGNCGSCFLINEESQSESDASNECDIGNGNLITNQIGSLLELSINNFQSVDEVFLSSFIDLLGDLTEAEDSINGSYIVRTDLSVEELKPLIDGGSLSRSVSVEFSSFPCEESEDGC